MSEMSADPWAPTPPAPVQQGFNAARHFEEAFRTAVAETTALQAIAWAALVERFGSASALQLAPVLLPSLIEVGIREATESTSQASQAWITERMLQKFPGIPSGQPW